MGYFVRELQSLENVTLTGFNMSDIYGELCRCWQADGGRAKGKSVPVNDSPREESELQIILECWNLFEGQLVVVYHLICALRPNM